MDSAPFTRVTIHRMVAGVVTFLVAAVVVSPGASGTVAFADDNPPFIGWSTLLPAVPGDSAPSPTVDDSLTGACSQGRPSCVSATIADLQGQFAGFDATCDHKAVFSLAYLRTTQTYQEVAAIPAFFRDVTWVNREDAIFAGYYFTALAAWMRGDRAVVPPAWQIAFGSADNRSVTGSGDLLLGMNAHVNRDLPFVLAAMGLVAPDGSSRKPDHDVIDVMLNQVMGPLLQEESQRLDPTVLNVRTPFGVGYAALLQLLVVWREGAWRNAELLAYAPDAATRAQVARGIENSAALEAQAIRAGNAYLPPIATTRARDDYCATHG